MAATATGTVFGPSPITNQQRVASAKPRVMARIGESFWASAVAGTVTRMMVQASTVSMISNFS
jgi:hypothetical protein